MLISTFFGEFYGTEELLPIHFYVASNINEDFDDPKTLILDVYSKK